MTDLPEDLRFHGSPGQHVEVSEDLQADMFREDLAERFTPAQLALIAGMIRAAQTYTVGVAQMLGEFGVDAEDAASVAAAGFFGMFRKLAEGLASTLDPDAFDFGMWRVWAFEVGPLDRT